MIHIFPTNRAIRSFYANLPQDNQLLPKAYSIQAFFEYALHVKSKQRADNLIRTLCMEEAIDFDAFELLHIPKNFMAFVRHEEYLFRFFEELSAEEVSFDDLKGADTYALYDEHLSILQSVYERYCLTLEKRGFYDSITLPKLATLDLDFIHQAKEITLHHEGYLSNFELRLFGEIASHVPLHVKMHSSPFNVKETKRIFHVNIPQNRTILGLINSSQFHLVEQNLNLCLACSSFSQRSFQVGFVFDQIARFIKEGIAPENIAVVLPDESFATYLHLYDKNRVLNFAMGLSVVNTRLYEYWNANFIFYNQQNQENLNRQNRLGEIVPWRDVWKTQIEYEQFLVLLGDFNSESKELKEILEKQLARFERLFAWRGPMIFADVLGLFLHELSSQSLDDVGGGPVTVLGLLETRGVSYEGVIIPDFNDSFIPKRSQKDWFLSSNLRVHANLPDRQARESLQRHYYYRIISEAKFKAISYVQNEQSIPSHFLHTFEPQFLEYDLPSLAQTFMPQTLSIQPHHEILSVKHKITNRPISASRLKTLLTCPRQYYYKYIEHLDETKLPHDGIDALEIGNAVHSALEKLYLTPPDERIFTHKSIWLNELKTNLKRALPYSLHWELESGIWANRFEKICQIEMDRFKEGWRPWKLEERLTCKYEEFTLEGRIDRIDRHNDGRLLVLDYKTGSTMQAGPKKTENRIDFQLIFYHLLASNLGTVEKVGYYDLSQGEITYEKSLEPSLERLLECLRANETLTEFEQTTKRSTCARCPYATLCQRKSGWN